METQTKQYRFINDPGHGWLEVELAELVQLGITEKISSYSYQHGKFAYLEEDCDAAIFLHAKFGDDISSLEKQGVFVDVYQDPTPIRHYNCYRG